MRGVIAVLIMLLVSTSAYAWDGFDWEDSEFVEIESGNDVSPGEEIEVYHWGSGYSDEEVQSVDSVGYGVEVKTYNSHTGEYNSYDMDK